MPMQGGAVPQGVNPRMAACPVRSGVGFPDGGEHHLDRGAPAHARVEAAPERRLLVRRPPPSFPLVPDDAVSAGGSPFMRGRELSAGWPSRNAGGAPPLEDVELLKRPLEHVRPAVAPSVVPASCRQGGLSREEERLLRRRARRPPPGPGRELPRRLAALDQAHFQPVCGHRGGPWHVARLRPVPGPPDAPARWCDGCLQVVVDARNGYVGARGNGCLRLRWPCGRLAVRLLAMLLGPGLHVGGTLPDR
jgi:hypothetical protein